MNFIRLLVVMLYLLCLAFVFSAAVIESGLGLSNLSICYSAIIVCLVFYVGSKVVMYMFLVERAHALRAPYLRRTRDWIWLFGMIIVVTGFGSIAIIAFIFPLAEMSPEDGRCRIGLPLKVTIPLLTFDIVINVALTSIFVHHLGPLIRFESNVGGISGNPYMPSHIGGSLKRLFRKSKPRISVSSTLDGDWTTNLNHENMRAVEKLVWKSLIGAVVVMIPTVINLTLLYHWQGREQGWLCFTICTLDATWQVCVVHWLTVDPIEMDSRSMMIGMRDPRVAGDSASTSTVGTAIPLRR
ncbi:hypothetical protein W97_05254 [Coniosporium apollinis CBS 100218]|uniref:G-protein coupled receptors family 1 profile domain-containing protein n=1 Tax=Coniosporium apollinis (strain CBS 100218) TaxID=1168221 RepID=R7YWG6_CONA1|nr:uncharacterized protein W97_05254 [Coniosporium apollinis CBS 100218]EON66011.1 hypothetical protein W97_05254 [Coniosporium apollinis CBS 100218]